jgi:hypothetical protein
MTEMASADCGHRPPKKGDGFQSADGWQLGLSSQTLPRRGKLLCGAHQGSKMYQTCETGFQNRSRKPGTRHMHPQYLGELV